MPQSCATVSIPREEQEPDESSLNVSVPQLNYRPQQGVIVGVGTIENVVESGNGQNLTVNWWVRLNGSDVDFGTSDVPAGGAVDVEFEIDPEGAAGDTEVCLDAEVA